MDAQLRKLKDQEIGASYRVCGYKEVPSKFGDLSTFILQCRKESDLNEFEMFATPTISSYIKSLSPQDGFIFIVRKSPKYTWAEIPGYQQPPSTFIRLN